MQTKMSTQNDDAKIAQKQFFVLWNLVASMARNCVTACSLLALLIA